MNFREGGEEGQGKSWKGEREGWKWCENSTHKKILKKIKITMKI